LADLTRIVDVGEELDGLLDAFEGHGYKLLTVLVIASFIAAFHAAKTIAMCGE